MTVRGSRNWPLCFGLACAAGVLWLPKGALAGQKAASVADLSGRWLYSRERSDDAREKMREAWAKRGSRMGPGRRRDGESGGGAGPRSGDLGSEDGPPTMRAIFEPADEITITQTDREVAIDEKFGQLRRLHPDGRKYKTDNGLSEVKTSWKDGQLDVETRHSRGMKVIERWQLAADRERLTERIRMQGAFGSRVEIQRVYDRARTVPAP